MANKKPVITTSRIVAVIAFLLITFLGLGALSSIGEYRRATFPERLLSEVKSKVFKLQVLTPRGVKGVGTAFLLNAEGLGQLIISNKHVCDIENVLSFVVLDSDSGKRYYTKVRRTSKRTDLCLLETPGELASTNYGLPLAGGGPASEDRVFVLGHPFLGPLTNTYGEFGNELVLPFIEDERPNFGGILAGRLKFLIRPGNSGSPVLNDNAEVIGVAFAFDGEGGLMIPLSSLRTFIVDQE